MKKSLFIVLVLFVASLAWADPQPRSAKETSIESEEEGVKSICPVTRVGEKCLDCHTAPTFALKEADPNEPYDYPFVGAQRFYFKFNTMGVPYAGYYMLTSVDASDLQKVINYIDRHNISYLIIELCTPGGSLLDAYKAVGLIREWRGQGNTVETRCYGLAASAGFLIFASGTPGMRFVAPQAELMWHELQTLELFNVASPSDKEDEAKVLRHLQDTANKWLAEVSGKSKEEIDDLVRKKEYWIDGIQAVEAGFADGLLTEKK